MRLYNRVNNLLFLIALKSKFHDFHNSSYLVMRDKLRLVPVDRAAEITVKIMHIRRRHRHFVGIGGVGVTGRHRLGKSRLALMGSASFSSAVLRTTTSIGISQFLMIAVPSEPRI